jgi:PQQ-dependent catabolism-associated CXXCW motif protein
VFIDVLRATRKPHGLPADTLWLPKKRRNIPGTLWLPDVGFGVLSDELEAYFRANLERATGSDLDHPIVIYCLADCWMSWNAAKRAASYGYTAVNWYPEGTDGWEAAGYPLLESHPVPVR